MIVIFAHLIQTASSLPTDASALESSISALESEIKTLEISSVPWEHCVWFFTFLVGVGVAMELWVIRHDWRDEMETWALSYFLCRPGLPGRPSMTKLWVEIGSVLLITIGVMGELGIGIEIASINGVLRGKSAELRTASDQLVVLLNQEVESEHSARVKIEARVAFRHLTTEQQQDIAASLKPLCSGQMVDTSSPMGDTESAMFAIDIANALQATKTLRVNAPGVRMVGLNGASSGQSYPPLSTGVFVRVCANCAQLGPASIPNPRLGKAIVEELRIRGFDARRLDDAPGPQILVEVNPHPEGSQGEYKLQAEQEAKAKNTLSGQK
jgi:hypothetical protein